MPATFSSSSIARCADDPGPPEPKVISPGFCFGERDELGERSRPKPGPHQQDRRRVGDAADLREVLDRIVRQVRIKPRRNRQRGVGQEQRVAVRRRANHQRGTGGAARAATVLDDHRLAELFGQLLRDAAAPTRR